MSRDALTTTDALFDGAVSITQPRRGYRFNVDALWLAEFALRGQRCRHLLDLGAGVGVVTLAAHHLGGVGRATLIESDPLMAELCTRNLKRARIDARVLEVDVARARVEGPFDRIVSNPPFFEPGERRPARAEREPARAGALEPFVRAAARGLTGPRARAAFVYPARNLTRLLSLAERHALVPKRLRFVHAFASEPARVVLVELCRAKPGGLVVEPPLVEWSGRGRASAELTAIRAGRVSDRS